MSALDRLSRLASFRCDLNGSMVYKSRFFLSVGSSEPLKKKEKELQTENASDNTDKLFRKPLKHFNDLRPFTTSGRKKDFFIEKGFSPF